MKWYRVWYCRDGDPPSVKSLMYAPDDSEWAAWTIDRIGRSNGSRTYWYEYQAVYKGEQVGPTHGKLSEAKSYVESR